MCTRGAWERRYDDDLGEGRKETCRVQESPQMPGRFYLFFPHLPLTLFNPIQYTYVYLGNDSMRMPVPGAYTGVAVHIHRARTRYATNPYTVDWGSSGKEHTRIEVCTRRAYKLLGKNERPAAA